MHAGLYRFLKAPPYLFKFYRFYTFVQLTTLAFGDGHTLYRVYLYFFILYLCIYSAIENKFTYLYVTTQWSTGAQHVYPPVLH